MWAIASRTDDQFGPAHGLGGGGLGGLGEGGLGGGGMGGGGLGAMRRASSFAEDNANKFYTDAFNRWRTQNQDEWGNTAQLAGFGPTANNLLAQVGENNSNAQGNLLTGNAGYQGRAGMEQGNIYGNAINQLGAYWNRQPPTAPAPYDWNLFNDGGR
jgi:hypothetical protein